MTPEVVSQGRTMVLVGVEPGKFSDGAVGATDPDGRLKSCFTSLMIDMPVAVLG